MTTPHPAVTWADPVREAAFHTWLQPLVTRLNLLPDTLRPASADASFRRYLRIDTRAGGSLIVMDAPPAHENCQPFVHVAGLLRDAGLLVPEILAWDEPQGFMLLSDLGHQTMLDGINADNAQANHTRYMQALDIPHDKMNVNGGAIAMGHPLGATGAMILGTLVDELHRRQLRYGLATLCVGGGMGIATIVERI